MQANPTLRWADMSNRGYMQVVLTPAQAVCEWRFTVPVTGRAAKLSGVQRARVAAGQKRLQMG
jgi:alkaline phosphatase D